MITFNIYIYIYIYIYMFGAKYLSRGKLAPMVGWGAYQTFCLGFESPQQQKKIAHFLVLTALRWPALTTNISMVNIISRSTDAWYFGDISLKYLDILIPNYKYIYVCVCVCVCVCMGPSCLKDNLTIHFGNKVVSQMM